MKKKVLFVCTHNSARSQMAEGILRATYGDYYTVYSAGTHPATVNRYAVAVMKEIGIDISSHRSKSVEELGEKDFDVVVTVCDSAKESCPYIPGAKKYLHKSFEDPSAAKGEEEEVIEVFRKVRDEIKSWIEKEFSP